MAESDWMAIYQDRKLGELHLPGSHDAGTTKQYIDKTLVGTDSNAATQTLTIREQLEAGTRFFDLRLTEHKKKIVAHHTTAGQGAYGKTAVDDVLADAADFCNKHKTEVAIFRISHTSLKTSAHEIAKASGQGALHTGSGNLCTKQLKDIVAVGGGLVCIFDEEKFGNVIRQDEGIHSYSKYKDDPANKRGISTCGCYSATNALHNVVCNGLKGQFEHSAKHVNQHEHLWQVYWQKTYTNPFHSSGIETGTKKRAVYNRRDHKVHGGTHASTEFMIGLMKGLGRNSAKEDYVVEKEESHREGLLRRKVIDKPAVMYSTLPVRAYMLPNILSYDFVSEDVNKKIIALNNKSLQSVPDDG